MTRPIVTPPAAWAFPTPDTATLDNGLTVQVFHRPGQYVASAALVLDLPLTAEPRHREGVAHLTTSCLDEGTATHPGLDFAETLERIGASLGARTTHSATEVFLDAPSRALGDALPLLAEAVIQPTLDAADVDRHRTLRLADISQSRAHPARRATSEFRRAVIGAEFRASRPSGGLADTVAEVTAADVKDFHGASFSPRGATLILAGDFADDPRAAAADAFGAWRGAGPGAQHERPNARLPRCLVLDRPGSVQADVRLGHFGLDRTDPRWPAQQMGVYALGGAFLSRLNRVLREERGYTYGVHLTNQPMRTGGLMCLQGSFRSDVAATAIAEALPILRLAEGPITHAEVTDAVNFTAGVTPLRCSTASGIVQQVATLASVGLPPTYLDDYLAAIRRVTPEKATGSLPVDQPLTLVVVGDAATIVPELSAQGWPVEVVPFDEPTS